MSPSRAWAATAASDEAASRILATFERQLPALSAAKQGHLAIRLWRVTGNDKYLPYVRGYSETLQKDLKRYAAESRIADSIRAISVRLVDDKRVQTRKLKQRAKAMRASPDAAFNRRFLFLAYQVKTLGLERGAAAADYTRALEYLASVDWTAFLLNPDMIRYNATRSTNALHYLETLGLTAPRAEYEAVFREVFMDVPDEKLDSVKFLNKIYGLTHLVIADSDFYQRSVSAEKHAWILEYLEKNIEEVIRRTNPDAVGEIAICFKLAGRAGDPVVRQVQNELLRHFEKKQGAILKGGKAKSEDVEHRNIVAYLALADWQALHPGPVISSAS